ncbi:required for respiratory growth protein 9, mitochondrial [Decorospora gaudefroyi]|uniref:Required for respiratory growth protein 9, mitochondrial n=1 Tax=Decorospora gaudefroyi TaxID=184978 RepID=A0A6A5KBB6_9PLEO|nr:required for respiratory growth protein 9, mitochondrial [Decorospora gaudefroyi]
MTCHNCARSTLSLSIRPVTTIEPAFAARRLPLVYTHPPRFFASTARRSRQGNTLIFSKTANNQEDTETEDSLTKEVQRRDGRPAWAVQKEALKEKLGGEAWNPRKKLSPDTMEGIRHLHSTQPHKFTTPVLADHFKVSPEAIRRILKSKWRPSDQEFEDRMQRWDKRGERIWSNLVEMGIKPPKKWREMGVGRAQNGERPKWKSDHRNLVEVKDSVSDDFSGYVPDEDIIPTVGASGKSKPVTSSVPLSERL